MPLKLDGGQGIYCVKFVLSLIISRVHVPRLLGYVIQSKPTNSCVKLNIFLEFLFDRIKETTNKKEARLQRKAKQTTINRKRNYKSQNGQVVFLLLFKRKLPTTTAYILLVY